MKAKKIVVRLGELKAHVPTEMVAEAHMLSLREYVGLDPIVVEAVNERVSETVDHGVMYVLSTQSIGETIGVAEIIDGYHRAAGLVAAEGDDDLLVPVILCMDEDLAATAANAERPEEQESAIHAIQSASEEEVEEEEEEITIYVNGNTEIVADLNDYDGMADEAVLEAVEAAVAVLESRRDLTVEVDSNYHHWRGGKYQQFATMTRGHICTLDAVDDDAVKLMDRANDAMTEVLLRWSTED